MNIETIGRVTAVHRDGARVLLDGATINCHITGNNYARGEIPAVGDWVRVSGDNTIAEIMPRKNIIARKAAGRDLSQSQTIAANIDRAFIVTSLNQEFNLRRIERYLTFLSIQGIPCSLVLTKSDICPDIDKYLAECDELGLDEPPICTSIIDGRGLDKIAAYATPGQTLIFLGSSGVGKSSIINYLLGDEIMQTREISEMEDKGRHTTTHRQLLPLPGGAAIIDSPGMRELAFWSGDEELSTFDDIEELAAHCKYRDCHHDGEPGCAVQSAIDAGLLTAGRLKSYFKMRRESSRARFRQNFDEKIARQKAAKKSQIKAQAREYRKSKPRNH